MGNLTTGRFLLRHAQHNTGVPLAGFVTAVHSLALPDAIERVAFPDFVPPEPGAPDFAEGELAEAAE